MILCRKMTPSRRIMSPNRRINTRGVSIQRAGYRKNDPHRKITPIYYINFSDEGSVPDMRIWFILLFKSD